jgi:maleate isomerase
MTCEPDYLVMGMSAITFYGGIKGANEFRDKIQSAAGVGISTGAFSCTAALKAYGGVKRISFLSPYYPVANAQVRQYFTEEGFEVVRDIPLRAPSWTGIAEITTERCRETIQQLDGPDVDAIVQVGTNLSMVKLAAAAELYLNKPVIAINTATYWHALRANGINDKIPGLGRLLEDF